MQMTGVSRKSEMPAGQKAAHPAQAAHNLHCSANETKFTQLANFLNEDHYKD
jgi:hypothetical protein